MLRFPAAFWVVMFHLQFRAPVSLPGPIRTVLENGAFAMPFFFILSGAMLAYSYRDLQLRGAEVAGFYRARFARIFPVYAVVHVLALFWFTPEAAGGTAKWVYINVLSVFGIQALFPHAITLGANSGTWSVSAELFFYALFPVCLVLLRSARTRFTTGQLFVYGWVAVTIAGVAGHILGGGMLYYVLPTARLPEFLVGVLLGLVLVESSRRPVSLVALALAALAAGAVALIPLSRVSTWPTANVVLVPVFAALIYCVARWEQQNAIDVRRRGWRLLVYLGECSYCLFLVHLLPMIYFDSPAGTAWKNAALRIQGAAWLWTVTIVGSLIAAVIAHEAIEKPARRALMKYRQRRPANFAMGSATTAAPVKA